MRRDPGQLPHSAGPKHQVVVCGTTEGLVLSAAPKEEGGTVSVELLAQKRSAMCSAPTGGSLSLRMRPNGVKHRSASASRHAPPDVVDSCGDSSATAGQQPAGAGGSTDSGRRSAPASCSTPRSHVGSSGGSGASDSQRGAAPDSREGSSHGIWRPDASWRGMAAGASGDESTSRRSRARWAAALTAHGGGEVAAHQLSSLPFQQLWLTFKHGEALSASFGTADPLCSRPSPDRL